MKKLIISCMMLTLTLLWAAAGSAFVRYEDKLPKKVYSVRMTGFCDYSPFGYVPVLDDGAFGRLSTFFQPMLDSLTDENNIRLDYIRDECNLENQIRDVRRGQIDLILGAYHQTDLFEGLELIYPAAIINPITIFMLPQRIDEIKTLDDMKKLKGVRSSKEIYNDFVENQLKEYNIETVDNSYDLFERLFTKKADYILISQYYGLMEASKLGLRQHIGVAKQTLWRIPMFVGISKLSSNRALLRQKLTRYLADPQNQEILRQSLIRMVDEAEANAYGVVPPTFGLENLNGAKPDDKKTEDHTVSDEKKNTENQDSEKTDNILDLSAE